MLLNLVPPGAPEILLFLALIGGFAFVALRVSRRTAYLSLLASDQDLPRVETMFRVDVRVRRLFRDREQAVILAEAMIGTRAYTFCASDFASQSKAYEAALKQPTMAVALYALASLENADADERPERFFLAPSGPRPNDYSLRGQIVSHRIGNFDGQPVDVYTLQDAELPVEVAVEAVPNAVPFAAESFVTGTARLYGYLPEEPREAVFSAG